MCGETRIPRDYMCGETRIPRDICVGKHASLHSKIEKLYVLNVVELISSIWGYCTIM